MFPFDLYVCVRVRVCMRARVAVCVRVRLCARVSVEEWVQVMYYAACRSGETEVVTVYTAFATNPPPADGAEDDESEDEDEDDLYDWFTFEQVGALALPGPCLLFCVHVPGIPRNPRNPRCAQDMC